MNEQEKLDWMQEEFVKETKRMMELMLKQHKKVLEKKKNENIRR